MTYETEAVILVELGFTSLRTNQFSIRENNHLLSASLDLVEERREVAVVRGILSAEA